MQCANCQHELLDTARFCSNCGTPRPSQATGITSTQEIGTVKGEVAGIILGETPGGVSSSSHQKVDTIEQGGTMVGTVVGGKDGPVHVGGTQHYGDTVQGNKTGGDNINVGDVTGSSGVAIGRGASASVTGATATPSSLERLFAQLSSQLAARANDPNISHDELSQQVRWIKDEVSKGEAANLVRLGRLLRALSESAPDIATALVRGLLADPDVAPSIRAGIQ